MGSPPEFVSFVAWVHGSAVGFVCLPLCSWVCCLGLLLGFMGLPPRFMGLLLRVSIFDHSGCSWFLF